MKKILVAVSLLMSVWAVSQVKTHVVQPKETVYGITHQYGITEDQLVKANPFLKERGLQPGDELKIPGQNDVANQVEEQTIENYEDNEFYYHVVKPKQTLYALSKEYDVTQEILKNLNSFIDERGLQPNDVVRIPKKQTAEAAQEQEAEVVVPEGMHLVKKGETVYGIAQLYDLDVADVYAANRDIQTEGIHPGMFIKIPKTKAVQIPTGEKYFEHQVEKDDTVFSLLNKYHVTLDELVALNPELENGLQAGTILKVPLADGAKIVEGPKPVNTDNKNFSDNAINLVWMMPFYLDSPNSNKGERQVAKEFFMGAQIALDRLMKEGKNVRIHVVDEQENKENIDAFLNSDEFANTDAIVGPFFQEMISYVAERTEKTNVPIFAPLINSDLLEGYKNVYMATPRDEYAADIIVDEVASTYNGSQEIKIVTTSKEKSIAEYVQTKLKDKFSDAKISITYNPNDLKVEEIKTSTVNDAGVTEEEVSFTPVLAILASENSGVGKDFVNIATAQNPDAIDGYSVFFVPALDVFDASNERNVNKLKEIGFTYTASRIVNSYGATEKEIIKDFNDKYCSLPNKYMAIGYDVVYDVVARMDKSGKISDSSAAQSATRLSSKMGYSKTDGAAKINKELRIIRLKN